MIDPSNSFSVYNDDKFIALVSKILAYQFGIQKQIVKDIRKISIDVI